MLPPIYSFETADFSPSLSLSLSLSETIMQENREETRIGLRRYGKVDVLTNLRSVITIYVLSYVVPLVVYVDPLGKYANAWICSSVFLALDTIVCANVNTFSALCIGQGYP